MSLSADAHANLPSILTKLVYQVLYPFQQEKLLVYNNDDRVLDRSSTMSTIAIVAITAKTPCLGLDARIQGLACNTGSALHVLVAGVGAGADEASLQLTRPLVCLQRLCKLRQAVCKIWCEGAIDLHAKRSTCRYQASKCKVALPLQHCPVANASKYVNKTPQAI